MQQIGERRTTASPGDGYRFCETGIMNHKETLEFLGLRGNEVQTMHLGLHRTIAMMEALGNPQNSYASIHIAGTNGKGSVAAMCESILRQAGLTTALFTSPHLVRVEERIRVNGKQISPATFAAVATRIRQTEAKLLKKAALDRLQRQPKISAPKAARPRTPGSGIGMIVWVPT